MSKLAHSNDATMEEIEFRNNGITPIFLAKKPPKVTCEAETQPKWYRPKGGICPWRALYITSAGKKLCRIHAKLLP